MENELLVKKSKPRPMKRRTRMALSCQRCRKHRSKCSRSKPSCEQCISSQVNCVYLEVPGDLESTALRDRFAGLEGQIQLLLDEFNLLESQIHPSSSTLTTSNTNISTEALSNWNISSSGNGISIDTHMFHVTDIYSTLIQFAKDNTLYPQPEPIQKPIWLIKNNSLFKNVRLSHFASIKPNVNDGEEEDIPIVFNTMNSSSFEYVDQENENEGDDIDFEEFDELKFIPEPLPDQLVSKLLDLYQHCLLYGAVQPFDILFHPILTNPSHLTPPFQLLYASIICHMLPHAFYWHRDILGTMDEVTCERLSGDYYRWAKHLLSRIYFDTPSLMICHAICNLVLYHIENGTTSVVYLYSGMAVRMALSLQLYREDTLDAIAQDQSQRFFPQQPLMIVKQYARSLLWFMYFVDTAASHYHNKPYEIHLDDVSTTTHLNDSSDPQSMFQWLEFHTCQITRDIRRTIFTDPDERRTSYAHIERIEKRLIDFQRQLPRARPDMSLWERRCVFKQWIRHHGHWILIHQSYLPTPISVERCTSAAFELVELFDDWVVTVDCYFRPCAHELKQACEILLYHVDQHTEYTEKALQGLERLITVLLKTPVGEISRTRPFVQRVLKAISKDSNLK